MLTENKTFGILLNNMYWLHDFNEENHEDGRCIMGRDGDEAWEYDSMEEAQKVINEEPELEGAVATPLKLTNTENPKMNFSKADLVTEITVIDPDTKAQVEVAIYKDRESGGLFGVDSSYIATLSDDDTVSNPFNGKDVELIDNVF